MIPIDNALMCLFTVAFMGPVSAIRAQWQHDEGISIVHEGTIEEGRQFGACLGITATKDVSQRELKTRIAHLSKQSHFDFKGNKILILDTHGENPSSGLVAMADDVVKTGFMDKWITVDYTREYVTRINVTAGWFPLMGIHYELGVDGTVMKYPDGRNDKGNLAYYFMADKCNQDYLVHFDLDMLIWSRADFSLVEASIQLMQENNDLVLVMPPHPGIESRVLKFKSTSAPIQKTYTPLVSKTVRVSDTTCAIPTTLAGRNFILHLERYRALGPRNHVNEQRCHASNKNCDHPFPCGGVRHFDLALECLICNKPNTFQAQIVDSTLAWVQHGPNKYFENDITKMIDAIEAVESGNFNFNGTEFGI